MNLPDVSTARLPVVYEAASRALAECSRIDECQQWADKAEALASYAKQARDESMRKMADRIQARAIRRCGELLKQIPSAQGARTDVQPPVATVTRSQAAAEAGLSERQKVTALRVASVPAEEFEAAVESDEPPTVTRLAEQGKKTLLNLGESTPADFKLATAALATLRRFADFAESTDPKRVAAGVQPSEAARVREHVARIDAWLDQFVTNIGG
jgi:hypothetical protein